MTTLITDTIAVGCDHAGVDTKNAVKLQLEALGAEVIDLGTNGPESVDYPDFAKALANVLSVGEAEYGVLICGTGIGISIAANRHKHIRSALCHNVETARLAREHNDANVLALGARVVDAETIGQIVETFFTTAFEGGRHAKRVAKLG